MRINRAKYLMIIVLIGWVSFWPAGETFTQESLWRQMASQQQLFAQQGRHSDAMLVARGLVSVAMDAYDPTHPNVERSFEILGDSYSSHGDYLSAQDAYQQVLQYREQRVGPDHPEVAKTLLHLAQSYAAQGQTGPADPLYRRALAIKSQNFDNSEDQNLTRTLVHLSRLHVQHNEPEQAEQLIRETLEQRRTVLGDQHVEVANVLGMLGDFYVSQQKMSEAESAFKEMLVTRELSMGSDHTTSAAASIVLADFFERIGNTEQSERFFQNGVTLLEGTFGLDAAQLEERDLMNIAEMIQARAQIYTDLGLDSKALQAYEQALEVIERALGDRHMRLAPVLEGCAEILRRMEMVERAEQFEARAQSIRSGQ